MYSLRVYLIVLSLIAVTSLISIELFKRSDLFAAILTTEGADAPPQRGSNGLASLRLGLASKIPLCKAGEGYVCPWKTDVPPFEYVSNPKCQAPTWKWIKKSNEWKYVGEARKCKDRTGKLCASFLHEELGWRNTAARKWSPSKFGPYHLPAGNEKAKYFKYNPQIDSLASCNPDLISPYMGVPRSNFESPCERIEEADKDVWLEKFRAVYTMHRLKWAECREANG